MMPFLVGFFRFDRSEDKEMVGLHEEVFEKCKSSAPCARRWRQPSPSATTHMAQAQLRCVMEFVQVTLRVQKQSSQDIVGVLQIVSNLIAETGEDKNKYLTPFSVLQFPTGRAIAASRRPPAAAPSGSTLPVQKGWPVNDLLSTRGVLSKTM